MIPNRNFASAPQNLFKIKYFNELLKYRGADKSLARPVRKQATATKL